VINKTHQGAFDFVVLDKNDKTFERSGTRNEDYFAFGKPLYAVCDAEVVEVITGVHDNPPGRMNPAQPFGNMITLKTASNEFIVYAHFEEATIRVKKGDKVKKGQQLGNCGNSGNSSQPHLHFHLQDRAANFQAIGATSYFQNISVNGGLEKEYSPVKNDKVRRPD
jgi:murein DD-endopeptidase MepM/ murein hydrolase activator NlpD